MTSTADDFDHWYEDPIAVRPRAGDRDLSEFVAAGKVPWEERFERIQKRFPSVGEVDWDKALTKDIDLFGRIVRDILKLEQATPGRPGPRPGLDVPSATRRIYDFWGDDFTIAPFPEALRTLAGDRSIRNLAAKVRLRKTVVHRLLTGDMEPDGFIIRLCAEGFKKHPSYFLEWRMLYIAGSIIRRLEWSPETTISLFRQLDQQYKDKNRDGNGSH